MAGDDGRHAATLNACSDLSIELGQAGGEEAGVDGAGDRRVDRDAGDDRCADGAGDVGRR